VSLADDLLKNFEAEIESLTLVPSSGGSFEISINGQLIYSKLQTGRHPDPGEVIGSMRKLFKARKI
jgi:selenoprotein W-related protein